MTDSSPFRDDLELRWVKKVEGSRRSKSTRTPGAERDLLRGPDGALLGPTESYPVDLDQLTKSLAPSDASRPSRGSQPWSPGKQMAADIAVNVAMEVAREVLVQGYQLVIAPKVKEKWNELKQRRRAAAPLTTSDAAPSAIVLAEGPVAEQTSTAVTPQQPVTVMDSVEYRERLALMIAAENFAAEQRRLLSSARISDEADLPPELAYTIKLVLAGDIASLDDVNVELLKQFLRRKDTEEVLRGGGPLPELEPPPVDKGFTEEQ